MSENEYRQKAEAVWRNYNEAQRWIEERRASHPWLAPGWCVTVPVRRLDIS